MRNVIYILPFLLLLACRESDKPGIVYVQNLKLYSEFDLAIELDATLQQFSSERKRELDSLGLVFENLTKELELMEEIPVELYQQYNDLRNTVMFREKNFEEESYSRSQEYDEQIWDRINGYVTAYAQEKDYDMILGASGDGSLMYAKDTLDITDDLITYCNNNYNGEK